MRLRQTLICFFLLSLREGSTALFGKDIGVRTATEGGKITVKCTFTFSGSRKVFCRNDCEDGDILVETSGVINWSGRYSIEYKEGNYPQTSTLIYVRITNLTKSDSGRYSCWLGRNLSPDSTETFELQVKNASASTMRTTLTLSYTSTSSTTSKAFQITNESEQQPSTSGPGGEPINPKLRLQDFLLKQNMLRSQWPIKSTRRSERMNQTNLLLETFLLFTLVPNFLNHMKFKPQTSTAWLVPRLKMTRVNSPTPL